MHHYYYHHHAPVHNPHNHPDVLDVILVLSNTRRFESRYRLFKKAYKHLRHAPNVRVSIVEMAFGERGHVAGEAHLGTHLFLRNPDELWHKENMFNLGVARLPEDWKYVCCFDADIQFADHENWARETIEALQHYQIVQPWSQAVDLGPDHQALYTHNSFCSVYASGKDPAGKKYSTYAHPGYCWAYRREAITNLGGLISTAILGAADRHQAYALISRGAESVPEGATDAYLQKVLHWQERADRYIKRDIGFVPGTILHYWHGKKRDRRYHDRWKILVENQFNPDTDLTLDWQGLWRLRVENKRQISLRDGIREYMAARNEDSIDME